MHIHAASGKGAKPLRTGAAIVLAAVAGGVYLGRSTVALIDPFYKNGPAQAGSSYTTDGWRGADAVSPPAAIPVVDRISQFVSDAYAAGRSYYEFSRHVQDLSAAYGETPVSDPAAEETPSDPEMAGVVDYQCVGCEAAPDDSGAAPADAPAEDCYPDDRGCLEGLREGTEAIEPTINPYY